MDLLFCRSSAIGEGWCCIRVSHANLPHECDFIVQEPRSDGLHEVLRVSWASPMSSQSGNEIHQIVFDRPATSVRISGLLCESTRRCAHGFAEPDQLSNPLLCSDLATDSHLFIPSTEFRVVWD